MVLIHTPLDSQFAGIVSVHHQTWKHFTSLFKSPALSFIDFSGGGFFSSFSWFWGLNSGLQAC
jgi:hypothetical protein